MTSGKTLSSCKDKRHWLRTLLKECATLRRNAFSSIMNEIIKNTFIKKNKKQKKKHHICPKTEKRNLEISLRIQRRALSINYILKVGKKRKKKKPKLRSSHTLLIMKVDNMTDNTQIQYPLFLFFSFLSNFVSTTSQEYQTERQSGHKFGPFVNKIH